MSKEIVGKLKDVENSLLKSIEGTHPLNRIEQIICIIGRIAHIKKIENEMNK